MVIKQYEIYIVCLDPTIGHEINKTRPCVVISPDEMNEYISTVIIAPITSRSRHYPTRVELVMDDKKCQIVLDQLRTVDKRRLVKPLMNAPAGVVFNIKKILKEMLVD